MGQPTQASGTAAATAFLRALAAHDPREAIRGKESLAEIFIEHLTAADMNDRYLAPRRYADIG